MKLDRAKLIGTGTAAAPAAEPEKKKKGGFGGLLKAAQQAAAGSNSQSSGEQPEEQVMIFRMTSDISDVKTTSVDASLFAPPAGYKLVKPKN